MSGILILGITTPSYAAGRILTPEDRVASRCSNQTGRDLLRCEARQKRRLDTALSGVSIPEDPLGGGRTRLQQKEIHTRNERNTERVSRRITFGDYQKKSDHNTRRRPFLNTYKMQQLTCMSTKPGRTRRLCLENAENEVRKLMKVKAQ